MTTTVDDTFAATVLLLDFEDLLDGVGQDYVFVAADLQARAEQLIEAADRLLAAYDAHHWLNDTARSNDPFEPHDLDPHHPRRLQS